MKKSEQKQFWILKTEPATFSIDDLRRKKRERWDGVRNYQARNNLRAMRKGDIVFIYHSSISEPAIVGVGIVSETAYSDPLQFDTSSKYYDRNSKQSNPRWSAVTISYKNKLRKPLTLTAIKQDCVLRQMAVASKGLRLSVIPVAQKHAKLLTRKVIER
jgi:predicted RNA-binding protein with PUA-like domain